MTDNSEVLRRWRMVLGGYAQSAMDTVRLVGSDQRADRALDYLYAREMEQRGLRRGKGGRAGSLDPSQLTALGWLNEVRSLFPQSVLEVVQAHAIDTLGLTELLSDPKVLYSLEPNRDLLKSLVAFKGRANPQVQEKIREVARTVVDEIVRRLRPRVQQALAGRPNRFRRSQQKSMQNFDWRATIRDNLRNYDPERKRIIADRLRFFGRSRRRLPWRIILCVDQSGSMLDSTIYAAVMAAILTGLPSLDVRLVVFDTSVVDLSEEAADPVSVLMSVQLGGGTDIAGAVAYCEQLVEQPTRTILALVTDFCEGGPASRLIAAIRRLNAARVTMIGLAALSEDATPEYDRATAERVAAAGMKVAALTPDRFADWLGEVIA
ncbi:VWA domain containing CoxE-like family protein [Asticcacaulis biprosthecium C19]|uniref:VWA domain containing CoxE-like family protein n=1 Tax=Asticcacaulis biprosthecium C19 TaxID=715226 RepID=F4QNU5_9CAUL|nr:VWA domain-containing protein [Asticcacaulis biprosthecium]EGF91003.1 VWA domain containing CoxE-like family protein [Asticcacaulis biprosthecium C19]